MPTRNIAASPASSRMQDLTEREIKCLSLVAVGIMPSGIAVMLALPESEIDVSLAQAQEKLGARNRLSAISIALLEGLLEQKYGETPLPIVGAGRA